jgi:hypothetical protein
MGSYSDPALILPGAVGTTELADGAVTDLKVNGSAKIAKINKGSYTGDNTTNRAIPHGLGNTPKIIFITGTHIDLGTLRIDASEGYVRSIEDASTHRLDVTDPDTTNFYVGNPSDYGHSANGGFTYYWVAIS